MQPIRAIVADHETLFRLLFVQFLKGTGFVEVVAELESGADVYQVCTAKEFDVAILDGRLPVVDGMELAQRLLRLRPDCKIMVLLGSLTGWTVRAAVRAGALAVVEKRASPEVFSAALTEVIAGRRYLSPAASAALSSAGSEAPDEVLSLSLREKEVLRALARGLTSKEIGVELGISEHTVKAHRISLMRKLNIHDAASLIRWASSRGLLPPDATREHKARTGGLNAGTAEPVVPTTPRKR
jgi:DNA-binding NarL/FixJ family response regulator